MEIEHLTYQQVSDGVDAVDDLLRKRFSDSGFKDSEYPISELYLDFLEKKIHEKNNM